MEVLNGRIILRHGSEADFKAAEANSYEVAELLFLDDVGVLVVKKENGEIVKYTTTYKRVVYSETVFEDNIEDTVIYRTEYAGSGCLFFYLHHDNVQTQYRFTRYGIEYRIKHATGWDEWTSVGGNDSCDVAEIMQEIAVARDTYGSLSERLNDFSLNKADKSLLKNFTRENFEYIDLSEENEIVLTPITPNKKIFLTNNIFNVYDDDNSHYKYAVINTSSYTSIRFYGRFNTTLYGVWGVVFTDDDNNITGRLMAEDTGGRQDLTVDIPSGTTKAHLGIFETENVPFMGVSLGATDLRQINFADLSNDVNEKIVYLDNLINTDNVLYTNSSFNYVETNPRTWQNIEIKSFYPDDFDFTQKLYISFGKLISNTTSVNGLCVYARSNDDVVTNLGRVTQPNTHKEIIIPSGTKKITLSAIFKYDGSSTSLGDTLTINDIVVTIGNPYRYLTDTYKVKASNILDDSGDGIYNSSIDFSSVYPRLICESGAPIDISTSAATVNGVFGRKVIFKGKGYAYITYRGTVYNLNNTTEDFTKELFIGSNACSLNVFLDTQENELILVYLNGEANYNNSRYIKICSIRGSTFNSEYPNTKILFVDASFPYTINNGELWNASQIESIVDGKLTSLDSLPDYYKTHLNNKIAQINELEEQAGADGETFVFITDMHLQAGRDNDGHSFALIEQILKKTNAKNVIQGGDIISNTSKNNCKSYFRKLMDNFSFADRVFNVCGNHETNPYNSDVEQRISEDVCYSIIGKNNEYLVNNGGVFYYYFDNPTTKIRYIVLNTHTNGVIDTDQLNWLKSVLQSVKYGWGVIIIGHWLLYDLNFQSASLKTIVESYKDKTDDFSEAKGELICLVCGHAHIDKHVLTDSGVLAICTTCDNYWQQDNTLEGAPITGRAAGTITQVAFDVYVIDRNTRTINLVRIGAGEDRTFNYTQSEPGEADLDNDIAQYTAGNGISINDNVISLDLPIYSGGVVEE